MRVPNGVHLAGEHWQRGNALTCSGMKSRVVRRLVLDNADDVADQRDPWLQQWRLAPVDARHKDVEHQQHQHAAHRDGNRHRHRVEAASGEHKHSAGGRAGPKHLWNVFGCGMENNREKKCLSIRNRRHQMVLDIVVAWRMAPGCAALRCSAPTPVRPAATQLAGLLGLCEILGLAR